MRRTSASAPSLRKGVCPHVNAQEAEAKWLLFSLEPVIDVTAHVCTISLAQRQIVRIAKAWQADAKIISMDDPTSSLTRRV